MANQGAKKRKEENTRHMKKLFQLIIACNVIYLLVRCGIMYKSLTWKHIVGLLLTSLAYVLPYKQLDSMAKPSYGVDGEMFDGGYDMSTGGICGYLHDVIYITCFVQLTSIISDKFWYTYLVPSPQCLIDDVGETVCLDPSSISNYFWTPFDLSVFHQAEVYQKQPLYLEGRGKIPAFAAYKLSGFIKGFLPQGSEDVEEDEKTRKKREKLEKKASRTKFVKTRAR